MAGTGFETEPEKADTFPARAPPACKKSKGGALIFWGLAYNYVAWP
jgi:hypothetical protein